MIALALTIAVVLIVLLLLGYPMKVPLLASALAALLFFDAFRYASPEVLVQQWITGIQPAALIAVP